MPTIETRILLLLEKWLAFQSYPTSGTNDQQAILDFTLEHCLKAGFLVKKVNDLVGWAQIGEQGPLIGFPVHLDVVPPGEGWTVPPFQLTQDQDFYYGRGIYDNKGPAAMMLLLIQELEAMIKDQGVRVRLIFGTQEETGMACIQEYVRQEEMPVYGFVPDALFPAVLGEKGRLHLRLTKKEAIPWLTNFSSGEQVNSVPDQAKMLVDHKANLSRFNFSQVEENGQNHFLARGLAAHGSKPTAGVNAAYRLLKSIPEYQLSEGIQQILQLDTPDMNGQKIGLSVPDERFGDTTINLGITNYENSQWTIELDVRFGTGLTKEAVVHTIQQAFYNWTLETINEKPCHLVEQNNLIHQLINNFHQFYPEEELTPVYMGGGTYASYFPGFISYGPKLANVRTFAHGKDERMNKTVFQQTIKIYREALKILVFAAKEKKHE